MSLTTHTFIICGTKFFNKNPKLPFSPKPLCLLQEKLLTKKQTLIVPLHFKAIVHKNTNLENKKYL